MNRRHRTILGTGAGVTIVAVATIGALGLGGGDSGAAGTPPPRTGGTTTVTRQTLANTTAVDGSLGHGIPIPLTPKATGTITWLPPVGSTVRRGQTLLRVNDRPVVLLYGELPMYRRLAVTEGSQTTGSQTTADADGPRAASAAPAPSGTTEPTRGRDVRQLETNLKALGYTGFTVDEAFSAATAQAVRRWQKDLGLSQTGAVEVGDVVYAAGEVRIAQVSALVGDAAAAQVLSYTHPTRVVTVNVPAAQTGWATAGTEVEVVAPGGTSTTGVVATVGTEAIAAAGSAGAEAAAGGAADQATVPVVITVKDQSSFGDLQSAPVTVKYISERRDNVLTVPVAALVALAEGGFGLELAQQEAGRFIAVSVGLFADGRVEVSGPEVAEGLTVRIPQ